MEGSGVGPVRSGSVGRVHPAQNFRRAARGRGSVGRADPSRNGPKQAGRVGRSVTLNDKSTSLRLVSLGLWHGLWCLDFAWEEIRLRILKSMVRGLEGAFSSSFRGVEDFVLFSRF